MNGIIPSLNTPFTEDGSLDICSLRKLVNHTIDSGCVGMLGLAVAGEYQTLTTSEKCTFIEIASQENDKRIPLIISVTDFDRDSSLKLASTAKSYGATGICIQIPKSAKLSESMKFLQELSNVSPEIIMVQDLDWSGGGLDSNSILTMFNEVEKFSWLKIETQKAGPKYSLIKKLTNNKLKVCGGWAVTQLIDALDRKVDAFVPTGMEYIYNRIHQQYQIGNHNLARELFYKLLPVLNFTNQHIDISIRFLKELRLQEGLFASSFCRSKMARYDQIQEKESKILFELVRSLSKECLQL